MTELRDLVRVEANERIDVPDFEAMQRGNRAETRQALRTLVFGENNRISGDAMANLGPWPLVDMGAGQLRITRATALGGHVHEDGTLEWPVGVGFEGPGFQVLDFTAQPANTYTLWVQVSFTAADVGARVFWNDTTAQEDTASIDTRYVAGWNVTYTTGASPGSGWVMIGTTIWNGAAHTTLTASNMLFEGPEVAGVPVHLWGSGPNDRDLDRATYGITNLFDWLAAMRRQVDDMIGGAGWWDTAPTSLTAAAAHIATVVDPHSANPTWTGLVTLNQLIASGKGQFDGELEVNTLFDCNGTADFAADAEFHADTIFPDSGAFLPRFGAGSGRALHYQFNFDDLRLTPTMINSGNYGYFNIGPAAAPDAVYKSDNTQSSMYTLPLNYPRSGVFAVTGGIQIDGFTLFCNAFDGLGTPDIDWWLESKLPSTQWTTLESGTIAGLADHTLGVIDQKVVNFAAAHHSLNLLGLITQYRLVFRTNPNGSTRNPLLYGGDIESYIEYLLP
tara:strand:- start:888 stop:2399 length:1512 start_codon:yes stop_codon:yes gene_type:complete